MDFWMAGSGRYAGHRSGNDFFDATGRHVGIFNGAHVHSNKTGRQVAVVVAERYLASATGGGTTIGVYDRGSTGGCDKGNIGASGQGSDPTWPR